MNSASQIAELDDPKSSAFLRYAETEAGRHTKQLMVQLNVTKIKTNHKTIRRCQYTRRYYNTRLIKLCSLKTLLENKEAQISIDYVVSYWAHHTVEFSIINKHPLICLLLLHTFILYSASAGYHDIAMLTRGIWKCHWARSITNSKPKVRSSSDAQSVIES